MDRSLALLVLVLGLSLACGGTPAPKAEPLPEPVVRSDPPPKQKPKPKPTPQERLLAAEREPPPGEFEEWSEAKVEERRKAIDTFWRANPELHEHVELLQEILWMDPYASTEEAAAQLREAMKPKPPLRVESPTAEWKLFLSYAHTPATSEDWAWYSNECHEHAKELGALSQGLGKGQYAAEIWHEGKQIATVTLPAEEQELGSVGYLMAARGKEPELLEHSMFGELEPRINAYFK